MNKSHVNCDWFFGFAKLKRLRFTYRAFVKQKLFCQLSPLAVFLFCYSDCHWLRHRVNICAGRSGSVLLQVRSRGLACVLLGLKPEELIF